MRRIYFFGQDVNAGVGASLVQWINIDTWEAGFVRPGLDVPVNAPGVAYSPNTGLIYVFGGRLNEDGTYTDEIQTLNPVTEVFNTLTATTPTNLADAEAVYYPVNGKIFIFGGTTASGTRSNKILVFDPATETISDTSAVLPTAATSIGGVYHPADQHIYLFGGVWQDGMTTKNLDTILKYNPASPSTNPTNTGHTLAAPTENQHGTSTGEAIYLFGGYSRSESEYKDIIQKYVPATGSRTTLSETMPRPDDDARAFYDSVTGKVFISPWLHSDQSSDNEHKEKLIVHIFDPSDETVAPEPPLRSAPPSGWSNVGTDNSSYNIGSYLVIDEESSSNHVAVRKDITALNSGTWMFEAKVSRMDAGGRTFFHLYDNTTVLTQIDDETSTHWQIRNGSNVYTNIDTIKSGYQVVGTLLNISSARQYGLINRENRTAEQTLRNSISSGVDNIRITSSSTGEEKTAVDWVIIRKAALNEPTVTVQ